MDLHTEKNELFKAQMEVQKKQRVLCPSAAVCAVLCGFRWDCSCPRRSGGNFGSCKAFVTMLELVLMRPAVIAVRSQRGWLCWPCPRKDGEAEPVLALQPRADPTPLGARAAGYPPAENC